MTTRGMVSGVRLIVPGPAGHGPGDKDSDGGITRQVPQRGPDARDPDFHESRSNTTMEE
jgi:hypothetical protein